MARRTIALILVGLLSAACGGGSDAGTTAPPSVVSVSLSPASVDLDVGGTAQLTATVTNAGQNVAFISSNSNIASVSSSGMVTAVGAGAATITATSTADASAHASIVVNVHTPVEIPPVTISLVPVSADLTVGETKALVAVISGTTNTGVNWSTTASSVATVSSGGVVTAIGAGHATITATMVADPTKSATANITVTAVVLPVTLSISAGPTALIVGQTGQYTATVQNTANTAVTWQSSATGVATISSTGVVTALSAGTTTITATSVADATKSVSATLTVTAALQPDLVVDAVTAPATGTSGGTIAVTSTIRNQGAGSAGHFLVGIYYSTDATITTSDTYSGQGCDNTSGLAAGGTTQCNGSAIPIPSTLPAGTYYVGVIADNTTLVTESDETNNARAAATTIVITNPAPTLPDFVVDAMTAGATGSPGGTLNVTSTIRNQGAGVTDSVRVAYYFSTDANITTSDIFSSYGCYAVTGIAAGASTSCNVALPIPATLAAGTYYVGVIVDDIARFVESDETNNARASATATVISGTAPAVDLTIDAMTAPSTGVVGQQIALSATPKITGASTTVPFKVGFYFSLDANITTSDVLFGTCSLDSGLSTTSTQPCSGNLTVPSTLAPGTYYIGAIADYQGAVTETNETNNGRAAANTTVISAPVVAVAVSPATSTIAVAQTQQLTATVTGNANTNVTWSSSNPLVATVSTTGLVSGLTTGSVTVTATSVADPTKSASATVTITAGGGAFNMVLTRAFITQSSQAGAGDIALVAGRAGLIRAFVSANVINTARPVVRVRIYNGTTLLSTTNVPATPISVPFNTADGALSLTWNLAIPGSQVSQGLRVVMDVDPDNTIAESNESDNSFEISPSVVTLPQFAVRFVPIRQSDNNLTADVTTSNMSTYLSDALAMHPISSYTSDVHAVYTTTTVIGSDYTIGWNQVLNEIDALRVGEGTGRYYYGVIKPSYSYGGTGLGYYAKPSAMGVDWSNLRAQTAAHEWGHNFNRMHAPCGGPDQVDPNYPYAGGVIGVWGYDAVGAAEKPPTYTDLMGYCDRATQWVSDYTYSGVLNYRLGTTTSSGQPAENALIVWGRITPQGIVLEPSFEAVTTPSMPEGNGPTMLQGFDSDGSTLFSYRIDGTAVGDGDAQERHFAYAIPVRLLSSDRLARLRVTNGTASAERASRVLMPQSGVAAGIRALAPSTTSAVRAGNEVNVQWDDVTFPMAVVRDATTGEILSFARGGSVRVPTAASNVSVQLTDGLHSMTVLTPIK